MHSVVTDIQAVVGSAFLADPADSRHLRHLGSVADAQV